MPGPAVAARPARPVPAATDAPAIPRHPVPAPVRRDRTRNRAAELAGVGAVAVIAGVARLLRRR